MSGPPYQPPHGQPRPPPPGTVRRTIGQTPVQPGAGGPPPQSPGITRWLIGISVLFMGVGLVWAIVVFTTTGMSFGSEDWPNTLGMVTDCVKEPTDPKADTPARSQITYRYDVDDRRYSSSNYSLQGYRNFNCADYPLGKAVRVYYAPWRPSLATLTPGSDSSDVRLQMVGAFVCMLAGLLIGAFQVAILFRPQWVRMERPR